MRKRTLKVRERKRDGSAIGSGMLRRNSTSTTASKSQVVAVNVVAGAVAVVIVAIVAIVVVEVADVVTLATVLTVATAATVATVATVAIVVTVVTVATVVTVRVAIVDVAMASVDEETVASEVNIVVAVAAAAVGVVRAEKVQRFPLATRTPFRLSAAERSDQMTPFRKAMAGGCRGKGRDVCNAIATTGRWRTLQIADGILIHT